MAKSKAYEAWCVERIGALAKDGLSIGKICKALGLSQPTVNRISRENSIEITRGSRKFSGSGERKFIAGKTTLVAHVTKEQFDNIFMCSKRLNIPVSSFMREAAVEKAQLLMRAQFMVAAE